MLTLKPATRARRTNATGSARERARDYNSVRSASLNSIAWLRRPLALFIGYPPQ